MTDITINEGGTTTQEKEETMLNTATVTREDIKKAETRQLVELYNRFALKPIKKFENRTTAESKTWKLIQQLPPEETKKAVKKEAKKRESYENRSIRILVKENPKRPGSRAHKKFDILMKMDGKTIREFKKEEGRFPTLDEENGWPATELRWAMKLGLVKIVNSEVLH